MIRVGGRRLLKTGFINEPQIIPSIVTAEFERRMRGDRFEEIRRAEASFGHGVPEPVITTGPDDPHIAAFDLIGGKFHAAVHVVKKILVGGGKTRCASPGAERLVRNAAGPPERICTAGRKHNRRKK